MEQSPDLPVDQPIAQAMAAAAEEHPGQSVPLPAADARGCGDPNVDGLATVASTFVYALGQVEPRFPSLAVEKEFAQALWRSETAGLTDRQALHTALSQRSNRYLARRLCWVLTIEGLETYVLAPRDPADLDLLIEAVRPTPSPLDLDVVVGVRGPLAPPEACNGLTVPIVVFDQLYSFDREALVAAIPRPKSIPKTQEEQFRASAREIFDSVMHMADNAGATDEHRALNYLAVRYDRIYVQASEMFARNFSLSGVNARPSPLSGARNIMDVVFTYTNRQTDVDEAYLARVDVTEEFPFLVTKLSLYFNR